MRGHICSDKTRVKHKVLDTTKRPARFIRFFYQCTVCGKIKEEDKK